MRLRGWRPLAVAGAVGVLLAGCGGGGGSDDAGAPPPAVIAETAKDYWNAETDARWAFVQTDSRPGHASGRINLVTIGEPGTAGGTTAVRFVHSSSLVDGQPTEELRWFDGSAVRVGGEIDAGLGGAVAGDYAELPAPMVDGASTTVLDRSGSIGDLDLDGIADTVKLTVVTTLATEASRTVPAGTFSNVVRARSEITVSVTLSGLKRTESATGIATTWYAPQVGPIRREYVDPEFGAPNNVAYEELSGVSVAAVKAGTVPGYVLLDDLGAGTSSNEAGRPAMAASADRLVVVSRALDDIGQASLAAAIVSADGTPVARRTLVAASSGAFEQSLSAAAWDGQSFHAFWVRPDGVLVGQRLAPDGTVLGATTGEPVGGVDVGSIQALAAASDGNRVLLVWQRLSGGGAKLEGTLVERSGLAGPVIDLGVGMGGAVALDAAWSSGHYFVTRIETGLGSDLLKFARLDADGTVQVADLLVGPWTTLPTEGSHRTDPRVVAHPDGFLVGYTAWNAPPASWEPSRLMGKRVDAAGVVLDAEGVLIDGLLTGRGSGVALASGASGLFAGWLTAERIHDPLATADLVRAVRAPAVAGAPVFGAATSLWYTGADASSAAAVWPVATAVANRSVIGWLEDRENAATPSDRVRGTFVFPPAAR
ncbi:MAG: hypothetical protein ROZ64_18305 [Burkholderiaceae bacterium]|nr:hypothetical protein [Burkholderiaceae bacterium]